MSKKKKTNKPSLGTPKLGTPKTKVNIAKMESASKEKENKKSKKKLKLGKKKGKLEMKDTGKRKAKVVDHGPTGRPRILEYQLPKPKEASPEKMEAQLKRLRDRKLVSKKVTSLIGMQMKKEHNGKKFVITGTKKGWFVKNGKKGTSGPFTQLYGVACNIVDGPRDPYIFFKDELQKLRPAKS